MILISLTWTFNYEYSFARKLYNDLLFLITYISHIIRFFCKQKLNTRKYFKFTFLNIHFV